MRWLTSVGSRIRSSLERFLEGDEARLDRELRAWVASMPGTVPIADAPERQTVRVAGEVRHIIVKPGEPFDELEAVLYDGSGDLLVVWLGRRSIRGLTLGSRVIAEGVIGETAGQRRMLDPAFELVPPGPR